MKRVESRAYGRVKISRFPLSIFCLVLGGLLLTSGVHVGLIVLMNRLALDDIIQTIVPLVYWIGMSILVTLLIIRLTTSARP